MKLITEKKIYDGLQTELFGQNVCFYPEIKSTNSTAFELAQRGEKEGTVIIAEKQTGGKGRRGREWFSPPGTGLWFSIILRPDISSKDIQFLTINASLAIHRALKEREFSPDIKWPNDILFNSKKACGILSELNASNTGINFAVTGIGINVNQVDFPNEVKDQAVSLYQINNKKIDRILLLQDILYYFENYYFKFLKGNKKELLKMWKERIALLGKNVSLKSDGQVYHGKAVDIAKDGRLVICDKRGQLLKFWAGDTSLLK